MAARRIVGSDDPLSGSTALSETATTGSAIGRPTRAARAFDDSHSHDASAREVSPDGSYRRIRLEIVSAELVRDDDGDPNTPDVVSPMTVPSGKVDVVAPFQVSQ